MSSSRHRLLAVLLVVAAVLTIAGSVLALYQITVHPPGFAHTDIGVRTAWSSSLDNPLPHMPNFGLPLAVAAGVALLAAVPLYGGRHQTIWPEPAATLAAGMLVAAIWTTVVVARIEESGYRYGLGVVGITTGAGTWLLTAAGVLAIAVAIIAVYSGTRYPLPDGLLTTGLLTGAAILVIIAVFGHRACSTAPRSTARIWPRPWWQPRESHCSWRRRRRPDADDHDGPDHGRHSPQAW